MPDDPLLMGLDLGTTRIRAIAFTAAGKSVAEGSRPTPAVRTGPDHAHYEADTLWQSTVEAIRDCVSGSEGRGRIVGVAAASVGESAVPLDADDRPTHPAIAWFDNRSEPQCRALERSIGKKTLGLTSGLSTEPIFGLFKIKWIQENAPEAYSRARRWLNLADFVAYRLSGVAATDYSLGTRTGALNLAGLHWAEDLIQEADVDPALFQPLQASGTPLGPVTSEAAAATGLPADCIVAVGGHDHICGALASGAFRPGNLLDSMGSAEALLQGLDAESLDLTPVEQGFDHGVLMTERPNYFRVAGCMTSGVSTAWCQNLVTSSEADRDALIDEAWEAAPGAGGVRFLPHLRYATPPCVEKPSTGVFWGLTPDTRRGELYRAVLEGVAYDLQRLMDAFIALPDSHEPREIRAIGGSTHNDLLMAIKVALADYPIVVLDQPEAVSLGAALLAGVAAGVYENSDAGVAAVEPAGRIIRDEHGLGGFYRDVYRTQVLPDLEALAASGLAANRAG